MSTAATSTLPSPFVELDRQAWAHLRENHPLNLDEGDLSRLRGLSDPIDLEEVQEVYLPLSRLLTFYVSATTRLHRITSTFLGERPPKAPFVIGVAGSVAVGKSTTIDALGADLGPIYEMQVFRQKFVFIASAELTAELCDESQFCKALPPAIEALRDYAGDGLFTARNDESNWQLAHDLLMPAFTKSAMRSYHPIMLQTAGELFDYWDALPTDPAGTTTVDVTRDMTKLTMETLSRTAFSHDFGSFTSAEQHPFVSAMIRALETGRRKGALRTAPGGRYLTALLDRRNARSGRRAEAAVVGRHGQGGQHEVDVLRDHGATRGDEA